MLTTVRVANDYKEIVEKDMEQIMSENKRAHEKVKTLEAQLDKLKSKYFIYLKIKKKNVLLII